jgi:hypothetical protein
MLAADRTSWTRYLGEDAEFYVRMGNSTRLYNTRDAMEYIRSRW